MASNQICVVGIGCCTSVGNDLPSSAAAVRAAIAGFNEHPILTSKDGEPYILAMAPAVDPEFIGTLRMNRLSSIAVLEASKPIEDLKADAPSIPVLVGLPEPRPRLDDELEATIAREIEKALDEQFPLAEIKTAARGHSAGLMAIESATELLRHGSADFCLAGGVDSYVDPDTLDWLESNEQLHKPSNAWGFIPGEAAAFCLLCTAATAGRYQLPIRARIIAITTAVEHNRIKTDTVCVGEGLTEAVATVVRELPKNQRIQRTYCDQNGEAYRADEFGFMLARMSDQFSSSHLYVAPADCWGDVGAASGPLFLGLHAVAAEKGYARGSLSLLWTSSEGGERAAALIGSSPKSAGSV